MAFTQTQALPASKRIARARGIALNRNEEAIVTQLSRDRVARGKTAIATDLQIDGDVDFKRIGRHHVPPLYINGDLHIDEHVETLAPGLFVRGEIVGANAVLRKRLDSMHGIAGVTVQHRYTDKSAFSEVMKIIAKTFILVLADCLAGGGIGNVVGALGSHGVVEASIVLTGHHAVVAAAAGSVAGGGFAAYEAFGALDRIKDVLHPPPRKRGCSARLHIPIRDSLFYNPFQR